MTVDKPLPTEFKDLKPTELYRSAIEDFALPVDEADKNKKNVLLAAFLEGGVSWADYVAQHPEIAPNPEPAAAVVPEREPEPSREGGVITAKSIDDAPVEEFVVRVAEKPTVKPNEKFLIKMVRKNPQYNTRGHKFTQEHPYALVSPEDADYILTKEDGFRQAFPSELAEFYG